MAIASRVIDSRSPVLSSMSSSRAGGGSDSARAWPSSASVVLPIAETTTTTGWWAARSTTRRATRRRRSRSATLLPPNFMTTGLGLGGLTGAILAGRWRRPHLWPYNAGAMPRDAIRIRDLELACTIGVNPDERDREQRLIVAAELALDLTRAGTHGHIAD